MKHDKGQRGTQTHTWIPNWLVITYIATPVVDSYSYRVKLAVFLSVIPGCTVQAVCIGFVSGKVTLKLVFLHCLPFRQPFIILSIYSSQPLKCEKVLIGSVLPPPPFKPEKGQDLLIRFCQGIIA